MTRCGSLPAIVLSNGALISPAPVIRIAWYTYALPESGSRIAPPRQVAAPPNGSIFVFEQYIPRLDGAVAHYYIVLDGARVYLGRNDDGGRMPLPREHLRAYRGDVHQRRIFIRSPVVYHVEHVGILGVRLGDMRVVRLDLCFERGEERRMAAVVRPICIDDFKLGIRRVAPLVAEVRLHESEIVETHRKALFAVEYAERDIRFLSKALDEPRGLGRRYLLLERRRFIERAQSALDGIDKIVLDSGYLFFARLDCVHRRATHRRLLTLRQELYALRRGVRALVELPGQVFHAEQHAFYVGQVFEVHRVGRGRREHYRHCAVELLVGQSLNVVAYEHTRRTVYAERFRKVRAQRSVARFSFRIYPSYHRGILVDMSYIVVIGASRRCRGGRNNRRSVSFLSRGRPFRAPTRSRPP